MIDDRQRKLNNYPWVLKLILWRKMLKALFFASRNLSRPILLEGIPFAIKEETITLVSMIILCIPYGPNFCIDLF